MIMKIYASLKTKKMASEMASEKDAPSQRHDKENS